MNEDNYKLKNAYIYHHLASIIVLYLPTVYDQPLVIFLSEFSNIPSYIVYYYLKIDNKHLLTKWKTIQKYVYPGIRGPVLGALLYYKIHNEEDNIIYYFMSPVYIMGLIWSYKLFTNCNLNIIE